MPADLKRRTKAFAVTIEDCQVDTFRAGGKGGQNQNKRDTGARIRHLPSGAVGESRSERTQLGNKRAAFQRMAQSDEFQSWAQLTGRRLRPIDDVVDEQMQDHNLLIEYM